MRRTLILGLGSSIRGDDGVGIYLANKLKTKFIAPSIDVLASEETGYRLLDLLEDYQRLIVIDSIEGCLTRKFALRLTAKDFQIKSKPSSSHQVGIFNLIKIGKRLGLSMPSRVIIYGIPIERQKDRFNQMISKKIKKTIPKLFSLIKKEVEIWL